MPCPMNSSDYDESNSNNKSIFAVGVLLVLKEFNDYYYESQ